jgi:hypothetical protein
VAFSAVLLFAIMHFDQPGINLGLAVSLSSTCCYLCEQYSIHLFSCPFLHWSLSLSSLSLASVHNFRPLGQVQGLRFQPIALFAMNKLDGTMNDRAQVVNSPFCAGSDAIVLLQRCTNITHWMEAGDHPTSELRSNLQT